MHEALTMCAEYLDKFGGHEMAIGLSLEEVNFENFKNKIQKIATEKMDKEATPSVKIDAVILPKDITKRVYDEMKLLEPYGESNSSPIFACKNLRVESVRLLSNDKHLRLTLKDGNIILNAIGFNLGDKKVRLGDKVDLAFAIEINNFNNIESVQMNLKDIKKSLN